MNRLISTVNSLEIELKINIVDWKLVFQIMTRIVTSYQNSLAEFGNILMHSPMYAFYNLIEFVA